MFDLQRVFISMRELATGVEKLDRAGTDVPDAAARRRAGVTHYPALPLGRAPGTALLR